MKIAHLVSSKIFAGIEQHVFELASEMSKYTKQIILCDEVIKNDMRGVETHCLKLGPRYSPINIIKLILFLRKNEIDILHCHGAKSSTIGGWVQRIGNIKVVSTIHGHKSSNKSSSDCSAIIGVNKKLIANIEQGVFIPNWFNPLHAGTISSRKGPIMAIGRLETVKGFDLLIHSWCNIQEQLEIIGSGPEEKSLRQLITFLRLDSKINIVTDCNYSSIEEKYQTAKGLIISSLREGGPRVVLEAINHEVPVLGTRVGIVPELISNEFLVEPNIQESLQSMLEEMLPLLPQINMSGIKSALIEGYSINNASKKTQDVYLSLLKARS